MSTATSPATFAVTSPTATPAASVVTSASAAERSAASSGASPAVPPTATSPSFASVRRSAAAWRVAAGHLGQEPTATTLVVAAEAGAPGRSEGDGAAVAMPAGPTKGEVRQAIAA